MAKAQLTNAGLTLLTNAQGGSDTITFTKMALGDGKVVDISVSTLTALVSQKAEMPIVSKKFVKSGTYQIGAYFSNENITTGFYWRETGIFAKGNDGKEVLYCYVNVGDAPDYISVATDIRLEKYIYQTLSVGNSTTINITVNESEMLLSVADKGVAGGVVPLNNDGKIDAIYLPEMNYADYDEFEEFKETLNAHTSNKSNPHGVTKEQLGLGNVPNVSTNDQTPTYTEASTTETLTSGEKLSIAFGKIKKAITDLISHLKDTTSHITSTERNVWNGKANASHSHTPSEVGLGNVNNTSDANKPVSTAQATAIADAKKSGTDAQSNLNSHTSDGTKHITAAERTAWNAAGFQLLKTQSINTGNVYKASSGYGINAIQITGVDFSKYDDVLLCFDGKVVMTSNYSTATVEGVQTTLKFVQSSTSASTYVRDYAGANCKFDLPNNASHTFDNIKFVQTLKTQPRYEKVNGAITSVKKYTTINTTYNGNAFHTESWDSDNVYFGTFAITGNDKIYSVTTGTVYVYGKEK